MSKYWYTSDTHFNHSNIIKYTGRTEFMDDEELNQYKEASQIEDANERDKAIRKINISDESTFRMNNTLIRKWNQRVNEEDIVVFLGDFGFYSSGDRKLKDIYDELNGQKIMLVGNHDRRKRNGLNLKIESIRMRDGKWLIWNTHNPRHIRYDYKINFCGHVHEKWKFCRIDKNAGKGKYGEPILNTTKAGPNGHNITDVVNLSVDVWDYMPVNITEIKKYYWQWRNKYEK